MAQVSALRRVKRSLSRRLGGPALYSAVGHAVFAVKPVRPGADEPRHLLITAPGGGNIGDQAMFEAYLENVPGPITAIVRSASSFVLPSEHSDRVTVVMLPGLLYGGPRSFLRDVRVFRDLLAGAASLSITGADIMDGAYSAKASSRRALVAELASRAGINSRVLGFSWNGTAEKSAVSALRKASAHGVALYLRDPISHGRAVDDGLTNLHSVADTVFAASTAVAPLAAVADVAGTKPVALINVSGMISRSVDQTAGYVRVVERLTAAGYFVVLVPHVSRGGGDDIAVCRAVVEAVNSDAVYLVDRLLAPAEVRGLCDRASITVTGRMHLAIMSFMYSSAPVTLETQGKVRGLMELFALPELAVQVSPDFSDGVLAEVERLIADPAKAADAIAVALPTVRELARQNFSGLDVKPSASQ